MKKALALLWVCVVSVGLNAANLTKSGEGYDRVKWRKKMAKKSYLVWALILVILLLGGCSGSASVKGTFTTINTMGGDNYRALTIIKNMWEGVEIAKTEDGEFVLYINVMTTGSKNPGSALITIDGVKNTIVNPFPSGWKIGSVSVSQFGTAKYWNENITLSESILESLRNAEKVIIRTVNTNAYMGQGEGVDVTSILPIIKDFIKK